jgi:hypothetical protein
VEGPWNTELPGHITHFLQVKEGHGKVLQYDTGILDMVLQFHKLVNGGSATLELSLGIREEASVF